MLDPKGQFSLYLKITCFDLMECLVSIRDLEETEINPRLQQVRCHLYVGDGYHASVYHIQSKSLEDIVHLLQDDACHLFLSFSFLHGIPVEGLKINYF